MAEVCVCMTSECGHKVILRKSLHPSLKCVKISSITELFQCEKWCHKPERGSKTKK